MLEYKFEGIEEVLDKTKQWDDKVGRILHDLLEKITATIERQAKKVVAVKTGRLRASITPTLDAKPVPLWGKVSTNVVYAPFVEFGTSRMKAQPFLSRAVEETRETIANYMNEAAQKIRSFWG